ncbi:extracelullar DNA degradation protein EddA [Halomonas cupida]|uniref:Alkaline phosphatase D n=2 Tax=Halomonas cupida TaxID=44933 RepID=A0A1M7B6Q7_9GAMM|nr:alkaline phosphatase D family protein [Halomonas cupida]GEN22123.1 extracelullar DNA degradation protein EddA [Halomonas cupida]SHL50633.1 alkaline phosphatase D [Halomonas cupida]
MRTTRRQFLGFGLKASAGLGLLTTAPGIVLAENRRPMITSGVMSGDLWTNRAMIWSRADRPSQMLLEVADNAEFHNARQLTGPDALPSTGMTSKIDVTGLASDTDLHYRVRFAALGDHRAISEPVVGKLRLPSDTPRNVRFVWSGDTVGQGWGIDTSRGGMRIYETMRQQSPDFFLHSGDTIYADGPLEETVTMDNGETWRNLMTAEKSKVAETLDEYRGQYAYNMLDENLKRFNAEVPMFAQWDDHETTNNWYPGEILEDPRYTEKNVSLLAARARKAFLEYMPIRQWPEAPDRIRRRFDYGPDLEVFMLDMRTHRGANSANMQSADDPAAALLGATQVDELIAALSASRATWKVIASDMPVGLVVADGDNFEAVANGDNGAPAGREHEIARLLKAIHEGSIANVVWLTADVHYTAAHHYAPDRASFKDFTPFWEFVSGPLHAGTFGPNALDATFGPQVVFQKAPEDGRANLAPSEGYQFFGQVDLDAETKELTVTLKDVEGSTLHTEVLKPQMA